VGEQHHGYVRIFGSKSARGAIKAGEREQHHAHA
jgi:hypothetical protein